MQNAIFLGERFMNYQDSEYTRCILAECYMSDGKYWNVYELLKKMNSERAKYLFAKACLEIGEFEEGERALLFERGS